MCKPKTEYKKQFGGDQMSTKVDMDFSKMYIDWLKQNINEYKVNDTTYRFTLPFLDRNNDSVEMYIINNKDGSYLITDDGETIGDLQLGGFNFSNTPRKQKILEAIISAYGVTKSANDELTVTCTLNDLPMKKHMLAQCMVKVSDMFYLSKSNLQSIFIEDVQRFFDDYKIRYISNICITGKSKLMASYDFAIPSSEKFPERLIKVVNNMDLSTARNTIFTWNDTKEMRKPNTKLYTFIHNVDKRVSSDAIRALKEYGISPALWTERDNYINELTV